MRSFPPAFLTLSFIVIVLIKVDGPYDTGTLEHRSAVGGRGKKSGGRDVNALYWRTWANGV